jgi:hypothetical protein
MSCAIERGLASEKYEALCNFTYDELGNPSQLADLTAEADNVIGF